MRSETSTGPLSPALSPFMQAELLETSQESPSPDTAPEAAGSPGPQPPSCGAPVRPGRAAGPASAPSAPAAGAGRQGMAGRGETA